jgi:N-acetylglucosamine-6-phosphate deacetylase
LRNVVALGTSLGDALRMVTVNPATLLGIEFKKGVLRTGADADIVLLDDSLQLKKVWVRGVPVN